MARLESNLSWFLVVVTGVSLAFFLFQPFGWLNILTLLAVLGWSVWVGYAQSRRFLESGGNHALMPLVAFQTYAKQQKRHIYVACFMFIWVVPLMFALVFEFALTFTAALMSAIFAWLLKSGVGFFSLQVTEIGKTLEEEVRRYNLRQ